MTITPPRFADRDAFLLAGLRREHTHADAVRSLPAQWRDVMAMPLPASSEPHVMYGAFGRGDASGMDYLTGVVVPSFDDVAPDLGRMRVPAAHYAVFTVTGDASALRGAWQHIWNTWLPTAGRRPAETPPFERYGEAYDPAKADSVMEIWFPVEPS